MLQGMAPVLRPGAFVFRTVPDEGAALAAWPRAVAMFREDEGISLVEPADPDAPLAMAWITLTVHSALDGVGLTAGVSGALDAAGIACNMIAAHHHDHVFVPLDRAAEAVAVLVGLAAGAGGD